MPRMLIDLLDQRITNVAADDLGILYWLPGANLEAARTPGLEDSTGHRIGYHEFGINSKAGAIVAEADL